MYYDTTDRIMITYVFCIRQNFKTMWECNGGIIKVFINFEKDSVAGKFSNNMFH